MSERPFNERVYSQYISPFVRETSRLGHKYLGPHVMGALDRLGAGAETMSPIASYDSSREAAGNAARAAKEGRYGLAGTEAARSLTDAFLTLPGAAQVAPFLKMGGAFIALPGARRLAEAKMRNPDSWGGANLLDRAQEAQKKGMPGQEVWESFGWSSPEVFAGRSTPVSRDSKWFTAVPTDEAHLLPSILDDLKGGQEFFSRPLSDVLGGVDKVYTAIPRLRGAPTRLMVDSDFLTGRPPPGMEARGRIGGSLVPKFGYADKPANWGTMREHEKLKWLDTTGAQQQHYVDGISVRGRTPDEALRILRHEALGHGPQVYQKVPEINREALVSTPKGGGIPAIEEMARQLEPLKEARQRLIDAGKIMSPEARALKADIEWREAVLGAGMGHAQYLDTPHERAARMVAHLGPRSESELKTLWPGAIDPYAKGMEAPFVYDGSRGFAGVPMKAYEIQPDAGSYLEMVERLRRRDMMRTAQARLKEREAAAPAAQLADE